MVWTILGSIFGALSLIIFLILMLPVYVRLENLSSDETKLWYKILWFEFGEEKKSNSPVKKAVEQIVGFSKFKDLQAIKKNTDKESLSTTAAQFVSALTALLKQIVWLLKRCTVNRVYIQAVSASTDPADAAMDYGTTCAIVYGLVGYMQGTLKFKRRASQLDLQCRYDTDESLFLYEVIISVHVWLVVRALFRLVKDNMEKEIYR